MGGGRGCYILAVFGPCAGPRGRTGQYQTSGALENAVEALIWRVKEGERDFCTNWEGRATRQQRELLH